MVNIDIRPGVVATRGSGSPDYSRTALGSEQLALSQQGAGVVNVMSVSGEVIYTTPLTHFFDATDAQGNNLREPQSISGQGRIQQEVYGFVFNGLTWDRVRAVSGVSGGTGVLAVSLVPGVPAVSGSPLRRYERGLATNSGDVVVSSPASGHALVVKSLYDSYMGNSGQAPVGYRFGQNNPLVFQHQVGATLPNFDKNLLGQEIALARETASGVGDLMISVGVATASGIAYTAIVEEA